jgi:hypothetical protein
MNLWTPPSLPQTDAAGFQVTDAAVAAAIGICVCSRDERLGVRLNHAPCGWCSYPRDELMAALCGFWRWGGAEREEHRFRTLSGAAQHKLVAEAAQVQEDAGL